MTTAVRAPRLSRLGTRPAGGVLDLCAASSRTGHTHSSVRGRTHRAAPGQTAQLRYAHTELPTATHRKQRRRPRARRGSARRVRCEHTESGERAARTCAVVYTILSWSVQSSCGAWAVEGRVASQVVGRVRSRSYKFNQPTKFASTVRTTVHGGFALGLRFTRPRVGFCARRSPAPAPVLRRRGRAHRLAAAARARQTLPSHYATSYEYRRASSGDRRTGLGRRPRAPRAPRRRRAARRVEQAQSKRMFRRWN